MPAQPQPAPTRTRQFERVAVALASPSVLSQFINKASRLLMGANEGTAIVNLPKLLSVAEAFRGGNERLIIFLTGHPKDEDLVELNRILARFDLTEHEHYELASRPGNPNETLPQLCLEYQIDLLILGDDGRDDLIDTLFGTLTRNMLKQVRSSVWVVPCMEGPTKRFERMVIGLLEEDDEPRVWEAAADLIDRLGVNEVHVVREVYIPGQEHSQNIHPQGMGWLQSEREALRKTAEEKLPLEGVRLVPEVLLAKPGLGLAHYTRHVDSDLMLLGPPDETFSLMDRVFPHGVEYCLAHLPSNLLVVHA